MSDNPATGVAARRAGGRARHLGPLALRLLRSRMAANLSATLYLQLVQLAIQFGSVPVLVAWWGLSGYGVWLILFTFPSYLAMADLGFASAAINDMTMRAARGDRDGAATTFLALKLILLGVTAITVPVSGAVLYLFFPHALDFAQTAAHGHARLVMLALVGYGVMSLSSNAVSGGYRAANLFAFGAYIYVTFVLLEAAVALALVVAGGGLLGAALGYLCTRAACTAVLALVLRRKIMWLHGSGRRAAISRIGPLLEPALSALALPGALALSIQGAVLVIGSAAGPAAVPVFTTIRTLTRTALQLTMMVNLSAIPRFCVAAATDDRPRMTQFVVLCLAASAALLIPAVPALLLLGRPILLIWTHSRIDPPFTLLAIMVGTMLLNGIWMPLANFIFAMNRHGSYTYFYLLVSAAGLLLAYPLASAMGSAGAAIALALVDAVMLGRIVLLARRYGMLEGGLVRRTIGEALDAVRGRRAAP